MEDNSLKRLPLPYWLYPVLAVMAVVPGLGILSITFQQASYISYFFEIMQFLTTVYVSSTIIYTTYRLKQGTLPSVTQYKTLYVTRYSPSTKIHRIMIGSILFATGMNLSIGSYYLYFLGLAILGMIGLILFTIGLGFGYTGTRIPDRAHATPSTSTDT